ncbi:MAG TPA: hypothetical protein VK479_09065 [Micropepsaceae bacterium]|nr:hypothetical protein [Micropepsaceae bacterium]
MARAALAHLSERKETGQAIPFDSLRVALFLFHLAIMAYVTLGWLIPSRVGLYIYTLLLPLIAMQWLLNGGASIVNNIENLVRVGQWNDARNQFEGAFFKTLLQAIGVPASQAQITTLLCFLMLIFWISAVCHMMLIVPTA